ncbi:MAG: outer membrane lipoprotein-sorting protein [Deltaproteobacteria bacterium]|nr:outer membrane lipoprotein-sorting protein [Deltaproteobacteria bacterium]
MRRSASAGAVLGLTLALLLAAIAGAGSAAAQSARELLDQVKALNGSTRKWSDRTQRLTLRITDRRGNERVRDLVIYMKKYPEDASRSIVFFDSPPEIKGTGFLQWANAHKPDEQWLYLPELKRVRQIAAGSKRESFVGTDFSYEDLAIISQITDWSEADASTALLRQEEIDGAAAAALEFTPTGKDLGYARVRIWLRLADLVILKFEFDDKKGGVAKVLTASDIRPVGSIPTAFRFLMQNVQSGSHTTAEFNTITYDNGLADDVFTQRMLERGGV